MPRICNIEIIHTHFDCFSSTTDNHYCLTYSSLLLNNFSLGQPPDSCSLLSSANMLRSSVLRANRANLRAITLRSQSELLQFSRAVVFAQSQVTTVLCAYEINGIQLMRIFSNSLYSVYIPTENQIFPYCLVLNLLANLPTCPYHPVLAPQSLQM